MSRSNPRNSGFFYTLGTYLGRPLAWVLHKEQPVVNWLVRQGCSVLFAKRLLIIINLVIIVSLLFLFLPYQLISVFIVLAFMIGIQMNIHTSQDEEKFHVFGEDDPRNEPGYDPVLYNDHSHEQYDDAHDK